MQHIQILQCCSLLVLMSAKLSHKANDALQNIPGYDPMRADSRGLSVSSQLV